MDSLIDLEIKEFNYYQKKVPLFYQNSYGFLDMLRSMFNPLRQGIKVMEDLLYGRYIFDNDYSEWINMLEGSEEGTVSSILDHFAEYYGLSRILAVNGEELTLTNDELLLLIRAQVIKNNFDGTAKQARQFYSRALSGYNSEIVVATTGSAKAKAYLRIGSLVDKPITDNIKKLFLGGYLTIESVGIQYTYEIAEISKKYRFTLEGNSYEAFANSSWERWFASDLNTSGLRYSVNSAGLMMFGGGDYLYKQGTDIELRPSDIIEENAVYIIR